MNFKKLALAAAIATAPAAGLAMEPMEDAALSGVTGQDGISISLSTQLSTDVYIHDTDGLGTTAKTNQAGTNYTYSDSGAIVINNFGLSDGAATPGDAIIGIDIDAGADANGATPTLNVDVTLGNATTDTEIDLGNLQVADSNRTDLSAANADWGINGGSAAPASAIQVMDLGTLTLGGNTTIGIQLGNEPQGHMIWLDTTITGGINLANFSISDADSSGSLGAANLAIVNSGGTDLVMDVGVDAVPAGLQVTLNQFGDATNGADIQIVDQYLGTNASANVIGDVEVVGLNLNGTTLTITGK